MYYVFKDDIGAENGKTEDESILEVSIKVSLWCLYVDDNFPLRPHTRSKYIMWITRKYLDMGLKYGTQSEWE